MSRLAENPRNVFPAKPASPALQQAMSITNEPTGPSITDRAQALALRAGRTIRGAEAETVRQWLVVATQIARLVATIAWTIAAVVIAVAIVHGVHGIESAVRVVGSQISSADE